MEKEKIPSQFCLLCGRYKKLPFVSVVFGPVKFEICKDCTVVVFNLDRIIKETENKTKEVMEKIKIASN